MPHEALCTKKWCPEALSRKPEQMVCGVSALGGQGHSLGGVGRSAHQMTSLPRIDLFIVVFVALLTQGT